MSLQAFFPEAGLTLLLGKTAITNLLVSLWTEWSTHALSNFPNLSAVRLLLHVDHSKAKGGLFWDIRTQLSLNMPTEDELRTLLLESAEVLLLLDGYREGNQVF